MNTQKSITSVSRGLQLCSVDTVSFTPVKDHHSEPNRCFGWILSMFSNDHADLNIQVLPKSLSSPPHFVQHNNTPQIGEWDAVVFQWAVGTHAVIELKKNTYR